jgi:hypothetical protein
MQLNQKFALLFKFWKFSFISNLSNEYFNTVAGTTSENNEE